MPNHTFKLSPEQEDAFLKRYYAGETVRAIAADFGVSPFYYAILLERRGLAKRAPVKRPVVRRPPDPLTDQQREMIARYQAGEDAAIICAEFGRSKNYIYEVLRRHGLPLRERKLGPNTIFIAEMPRSVDGEISISFPNGQTLVMDEADAHLIVGRSIAVSTVRSGASYVTVNTGGRTSDYLHRLILPPRLGLETDHKNRNGLDCRRDNLRYGTHSQNCANRVWNIPDRKTPYRGCWEQTGGRWSAKIVVAGRRIFLGTFDTAVEAAEAYDRAALQHFGEFAILNFPDDAEAA